MIRFIKKDIQAVLGEVEHRTFQKAIENHWRCSGDETVNPSSVCWLFCWAKTGQSSPKAMNQSRAIFNKLFIDFDFEKFDEKIGHEEARKIRSQFSPSQELSNLEMLIDRLEIVVD